MLPVQPLQSRSFPPAPTARKDRHARAAANSSRRGLTLIEIMIATTLSLLLILAIAQSFATVSETVSQGRANLEMAERMRGTLLRLTSDLDSVSVPSLPWIDPSTGSGYLEIIEGWGRDYDADANNVEDWTQPNFDTSWGDCDDILAFTVISKTTPFSGYVMGALSTPPNTIGKLLLTYDPTNPKQRTRIISHTAEVIWWTTLQDTNNNGVRDDNEYFTLHRRVLLVRPDIVLSPTLNPVSMADAFFFWGNDLSTYVDGSGNRYTNTLQDLSARHRRTAHTGVTVPYPLNKALLRPRRNVWTPGPDSQWGVAGVDDDGDGTTDGTDIDEAGALESDDLLISETAGQDVILTHVLAFDVRVYDPMAPLKGSTNTYDLVAPGDPRYGSITTGPSATGEFVDLGYALDPTTGGMSFMIPYASSFSGPPRRTSPTIQLPYPSPTWDTWPTVYETDGSNQDDVAPNPILIDEGFDGIDNNGENGVDDIEERETCPPYNVPLRGVKVIIRCVDPASRIVRQEHVTASFRPY